LLTMASSEDSMIEARNACPILARWSGSVVTATSCVGAVNHVSVLDGVPWLILANELTLRPSLGSASCRSCVEQPRQKDGFWQERPHAMVDWEDAGGTATHPKEWHICTGKAVSHGNRHHTIQGHIENSRVGPGVVHRIKGGCDRGKWSDETIVVLIESLCRIMKEP